MSSKGVVTLEDLKAIKAGTTDFGSPVYFMTEQQFNYCLWHIDDYNKTQERAEKAEQTIKEYGGLLDRTLEAEAKLEAIGRLEKECPTMQHYEYYDAEAVDAILEEQK